GRGWVPRPASPESGKGSVVGPARRRTGRESPSRARPHRPTRAARSVALPGRGRCTIGWGQGQGETRSSKPEIRNQKPEGNPKAKKRNPKETLSGFAVLNSVFFRASDFWFLV